MNGVLVVDKPQGPTSHDIVARARRALGTRRIGHTGTLDPLATGVLALVLGRATRLAALLSGGPKDYVADVRFGLATPTYDAAHRLVRDPAGGGLVLGGAPPPAPEALSIERVAAAAATFAGEQDQVPPPYSAKKVGGQRSYERARRDERIELRPSRVMLHEVAVEWYADGLARIRLSTSPGFYVRSFAHDLGARLGCGAHLEALRRVRSGEFGLDAAVPLAELERLGPSAADRIVPLEALLPHLPAVVLTPDGARRARHGTVLGPRDVAVAGPPADTPRARLLDASGALVGIADRAPGGFLHPAIVLV